VGVAVGGESKVPARALHAGGRSSRCSSRKPGSEGASCRQAKGCPGTSQAAIASRLVFREPGTPVARPRAARRGHPSRQSYRNAPRETRPLGGRRLGPSFEWLKGRTALPAELLTQGFSSWHRGHFIAYSPRAGRSSDLATIARGREPVNDTRGRPQGASRDRRCLREEDRRRKTPRSGRTSWCIAAVCPTVHAGTANACSRDGDEKEVSQ
jgi:hypothetical protein